MYPRSFFELADLLTERRTAVLTGAGCSTESGIPDYRGPDGRQKHRDPILYQEFVGDPATRTRYWARSSVGWRRIVRARPNPGHAALARLEGAGLVRGIITQNVDGLHQAAGSRRVVELHGSLYRVRCLACGALERRAALQRRLLVLNPGWGRVAAPEGADAIGAARGPARAAPDGDARVEEEAVRDFRVVGCRRCGGVLKPDVVFFGENVPPARVASAWRLFDEAEALLVVGTSLAVFSGYRFVRRATAEGIPVALVNLGATRADADATVRVRGKTGEVLPRLADELLGPD